MNERHAKILELLSRYHKMEVSRLSTLLNVSQVTIRKDLIALEQSGMLVREHGYATLNNSDDINKRLAFHFEQKMQIVKDMAKQVEKVIVVTDSSKFYQKGNVSLIATNRIHMLITNPDIPLEQEQYLLEQKVEIIKA